MRSKRTENRDEGDVYLKKYKNDEKQKEKEQEEEKKLEKHTHKKREQDSHIESVQAKIIKPSSYTRKAL